MFKSNKGFTLVELIVVIAILAILAGVAIPVYNGYIKRAQDASVVTELDAIATAAQAANATVGQIDLIVVTPDEIQISGPNQDGKSYLAGSFNADFALFYPDATDSYDEDVLGKFAVALELKGSYEEGAYWENGKWNAGVHADIDTNYDADGAVVEEGSGEGTGGEGTGGEGTGSEGTGSEGTGSEGTGSEGTGSEGTGSEGTGSEGTGDDWQGDIVQP